MFGTNGSVGNPFISNRAWIRGNACAYSVKVNWWVLAPKAHQTARRMVHHNRCATLEELHDAEEEDVGDQGEEGDYCLQLTLDVATPKQFWYLEHGYGAV